jgi:hypothetical protein
MRPNDVASTLAQILGTELYDCDRAIRSSDSRKALAELSDAVVKIEQLVRRLHSARGDEGLHGRKTSGTAAASQGPHSFAEAVSGRPPDTRSPT